jgi:hypothetical protein
MKYAILNIDGTPKSFYDDKVHKKIPKEAINISDEQWLECINNQGTRAFINGQLVEYVYQPTEAEIIAKKVQEHESYLINTAWYVERFNDPSSGKPIPEEVLTKRAEAREYISANKVM